MFLVTKKRGLTGLRLLAVVGIIAGLVLLNEPWIRQSHHETSSELIHEQLIKIQNAKIAYITDKEAPLGSEVTLDDLLRHAEEVKARYAMEKENYDLLMEQRESGLEVQPEPPMIFRGTLTEKPFFSVPGELIVGPMGELPKYVGEDGTEYIADFKTIYGIDPAELEVDPS